MIYSDQKKAIMKKFAKHESDSGSSEVQIALLTAKIKDLTEHFKVHKHDHHSRRGLLNMVSNRKSLLKYLKTNKLQSYKNLIAELGIRK